MGTGMIEQFFLSNNSTYTVKVNGVVNSQPGANLDGYQMADPNHPFNLPINTSTYVIPYGTASPKEQILTPYGVSATLTWGPATPTSGTVPTAATQR
jgi:hypothetical protein